MSGAPLPQTETDKEREGKGEGWYGVTGDTRGCYFSASTGRCIFFNTNWAGEGAIVGMAGNGL